MHSSKTLQVLEMLRAVVRTTVEMMIMDLEVDNTSHSSVFQCLRLVTPVTPVTPYQGLQELIDRVAKGDLSCLWMQKTWRCSQLKS
jgi:hypothetical protein